MAGIIRIDPKAALNSFGGGGPADLAKDFFYNISL
jgi:hypothetical protein